MTIESEMETRIGERLPGSTVTVSGDGYRWTIEVVSDAFEGQSRVKKQQMVYSAIEPLIRSGAVHAVTIVARTPAEAEPSGG